MSSVISVADFLLWNWNNRGNFGDFFAEVSGDAILQGHRAAGTAVAGAVEADFDDAVFADVDQFDIAAIGLHCGADQVDHALHFVANRGLVGGRGHQFLT